MFQAIIDFLYRHPRSLLKKYKRFGGYANYSAMMRSSELMQKASADLPSAQSVADGLPVYFLTGKKYLYQTLFCIQSLIKHSPGIYKFVLVDDGTFDTALQQQIARQLPGAKVFTAEMIAKNLEAVIPAGSFPVLHHKRQVYPHLKKLTDIHTIPGSEWKLVLDSDMLFWKEPAAILDWLKQTDRPLYMQDCQNSYGYTKELMQRLCGNPVADLVNVGVIGLNSTTIDWQKLENWIAALEEKEGTSYYLEQALTAMIVGESKCRILPADEYMVNPDDAATQEKKGVLHHYVDLSKEGYFKQAWKKV